MDELSPEPNFFAWDGIGFAPPLRWELAEHRLRKGVSTIALEDEASRRLELEWLRPKTPPDAQHARRRFDRITKDLTAAATIFAEIGELPGGWKAFRFSMPEHQTLVLAYFTPSQTGDPMCFLRLHFGSAAKEPPTDTLRAVLRSFQIQRSELRLWQFYDVRFQLSREFRLTATSLQAGRKMLLFERGFRRLFVWHISLADIILKKQAMGPWCADFLNGFRAIKGPRFRVAGDALLARRSRWRPFGHYEEIGRWCFRYAVGCRHLAEHNQIAIWFYNCRSRRDLTRFPDQFPLAAVPLDGRAPGDPVDT